MFTVKFERLHQHLLRIKNINLLCRLYSPLHTIFVLGLFDYNSSESKLLSVYCKFGIYFHYLFCIGILRYNFTILFHSTH